MRSAPHESSSYNWSAAAVFTSVALCFLAGYIYTQSQQTQREVACFETCLKMRGWVPDNFHYNDGQCKCSRGVEDDKPVRGSAR